MKSLICFSFLAILFVIACKPTGGTTPPLKGTIDSTTARRLVHNFNGREFNRGVPGWHGSRCVWFSKEQLKSFIEQIYKEDSSDGVRFYFAAYDSNIVNGVNTKPDYCDQSTLVMVSTSRVIDGKDTLHFDYYNDKNPKGGILTAIPENQGELCPPPIHCTAIGAKLLDN